MANITASLVVNFGASADASNLLVAELDALLNEDKTTFAPSDTAFFLIFKSANVTLSGKPTTSSGMVQGGATVSRTITEQLTFETSESEVTLSKIPSGSVSFGPWYGNTDPAPEVVGRVVTIQSAYYPAIVEVEYQTEAISYELIPPTIDTATYEEWPIIVVVSGTAA